MPHCRMAQVEIENRILLGLGNGGTAQPQIIFRERPVSGSCTMPIDHEAIVGPVDIEIEAVREIVIVIDR